MLDYLPVGTLQSSAEEIWGMIVFVEAFLLYNTDTGTASQQETIAETVCHETSHQVIFGLLDIYLFFANLEVSTTK